MDCPECDRLFAGYSLAAREITNALMAKEHVDRGDTWALGIIADRIAELEKTRRVAGEALYEHALSHGENGELSR